MAKQFGHSTGIPIPRAVMITRVDEAIEEAASSRRSGYLFVSITPILACILKTLKMAILGSRFAGLLVPRTPALVEHLEAIKMAVFRGGKGGHQTFRNVVASRSHSCAFGYELVRFRCESVVSESDQFPLSFLCCGQKSSNSFGAAIIYVHKNLWT